MASFTFIHSPGIKHCQLFTNINDQTLFTFPQSEGHYRNYKEIGHLFHQNYGQVRRLFGEYLIMKNSFTSDSGRDSFLRCVSLLWQTNDVWFHSQVVASVRMPSYTQIRTPISFHFLCSILKYFHLGSLIINVSCASASVTDEYDHCSSAMLDWETYYAE